MAGALAAAGHAGQARQVADQALTIAKATPEDWRKAEALTEMAGALAAAGHSNQALSAAQAIRPPCQPLVRRLPYLE